MRPCGIDDISIYNSGHSARSTGKLLENNPYRHGSSKFADWVHGWKDCDEQLRQCNRPLPDWLSKYLN